MGLRYKQYCSNIVRTLLVDPSQELQDIYSLLVDAETKVLESLKPGICSISFWVIQACIDVVSGAKLSDMYETAVEFVREKRPDLIDKMTKSIG